MVAEAGEKPGSRATYLKTLQRTMVTEERAKKIAELAPESIEELETASQYATAAAYPHAVGSPDGLESQRCLAFRVEVVSFEDLKRCLLLIGAYNYFDGKKVADAFQRHFPTEEIDGADGHADGIVVEIGREGSPVMYVTYGYDSWGDTDPAISEEEFEGRCEAFAKSAGADECSMVEGGMDELPRPVLSCLVGLTARWVRQRPAPRWPRGFQGPTVDGKGPLLPRRRPHRTHVRSS